MRLTDLIWASVSRIFTPPPKVAGRRTMTIPSLADVRDGRQAERVAAQCRECAKLLAAHLYVWRKPFPEKATVKKWNKETMSFVGLNIEDFQNLLMANFILKTSDGREWLADRSIAALIWNACCAEDSPLPPASWQEETN
jgi:hypothetical protein